MKMNTFSLLLPYQQLVKEHIPKDLRVLKDSSTWKNIENSQQNILGGALFKNGSSQVPVNRTYNHSYTRGRDQEDHSLRTFTKKGWWSGSKCRP
jgi:hypothetical protein